MSALDTTAAALDAEAPPRNGISGLAHWRHDLLAGLVVSLVSLPLSSGIAIASGAPPIYGILSSVIAGLVFPFVGGSYVTIAGPAAGLAPALLVTMAALGGAGDADHVGAGYHRLLVVIFLVGLVQIVLSRLRLARYAAIFPAAVVEGMLGAIGVLILVKALPLWLGYAGHLHAHGFVEYVAALPEIVAGADVAAAGIGVGSFVMLFLAASEGARKLDFFRVVPPHIFAVIFGVLAAVGVGLGTRNPHFLIEVPDNPLSGLALPAFGDVLAHPELWGAVAVGVLTLTLIDGVESLATAQAIDRIDPFKRRSEPDRLLSAMGISNVMSSLIGGLTIIPGGVKSKTCIEAGGRTLWANFANAVFLLGFLFVAPSLISLIPKATLGAILVYTGWKMMHPSIARHLAHVGREQVALYLASIIAILLTDLLVGVLIGTGLKGLLLSAQVLSATGDAEVRPDLLDLFRDPVTRQHRSGSRVVLTVERPLVCFNGFRLQERLDTLPDDVTDVIVRLGPAVALMDHTTCDRVLTAVKTSSGRTLRLDGLEAMQQRAPHERAARFQDPRRLIAALAVSAVTATAAVAQELDGSDARETSEPEERYEAERRD